MSPIRVKHFLYLLLRAGSSLNALTILLCYCNVHNNNLSCSISGSASVTLVNCTSRIKYIYIMYFLFFSGQNNMCNIISPTSLLLSATGTLAFKNCGLSDEVSTFTAPEMLQGRASSTKPAIERVSAYTLIPVLIAHSRS